MILRCKRGLHGESEHVEYVRPNDGWTEIYCRGCRRAWSRNWNRANPKKRGKVRKRYWHRNKAAINARRRNAYLDRKAAALATPYIRMPGIQHSSLVVTTEVCL